MEVNGIACLLSEENHGVRNWFCCTHVNQNARLPLVYFSLRLIKLQERKVGVLVVSEKALLN